VGAASGGRLALKFAAAGADVRILEINKKSASAVADEIAASGGSASFHACDVTDQAAVSELLSHVVPSEVMTSLSAISLSPRLSGPMRTSHCLSSCIVARCSEVYFGQCGKSA